MRKIFISGDIKETVTVTGEEHSHLAFSLRLKPGDEVTVSNQRGIDYLTAAQQITKTQTILRVISSRTSVYEPRHRLTLFFSPLKGERTEIAIQKCTELGVYEFKPFCTHNMSVKKESLRADRLGKIALEASKQCGRNIVPKISGCMDFSLALEQLKEYDKVIFPYENALTGSIKKAGLSSGYEGDVAVVIGSEGGFTDGEAAAVSSLYNAVTVTLGTRILRAETACIMASALTLYELGDYERRENDQ